jgi:DNA polymerase I
VNNFKNIVVGDFEYEAPDGELPNPLCMVALVLDENLEHPRIIKRWRGEFGAEPPFPIDDDTLFVAYSAWAELTCFQVLGWKFPVHIFDLHTAYLAASNILAPRNHDEERQKRPPNKLADACAAYGLEGWIGIDKDAIAPAIGNGTWRGRYSHEDVVNYCAEDVRMELLLLRAQLRGAGRALPAADVPRILHWSNYSAKCIAPIQARGMLIDVPLWSVVQENKAPVIGELLRRFDPSHGDEDPIYSPSGEYSKAGLGRWLVRSGVAAWPRLPSGVLKLDKKTLKLMSHIPGVEGIMALRDTLNIISKANLPIGRDGRNRPSLFPFGTATGRNAHARSLFNFHASMRSFMVFPAGSVGVYVDWRTQEVGVAAAESGDQQLIEDYLAGDIYHALARLCGLTTETNPKIWKANNRPMRDRMKQLQLGINYGMGVPSLARGLERHPVIAGDIIARHKRRYRRFWQWREDMVGNAMINRKIVSSHTGWPLHISYSPNKRTLYNFPMQSGGAEMLRLAAMRLCDAGIIPTMLIHDAILFEETDREKIERAKEIMLGAARDTCGGLEVGVDVEELGRRYHDKRPMAVKLWAAIMDVLRAIGFEIRDAA